MKYDYIIVGQGIGGTLLSYFLVKKGQKVLVIDNGHLTSSTKVAAGVVNPITGRRYVKSWMFEELLEVAKATYDELDKLLNINCFEERNIVRVLFNNKEVNDYFTRSGELGYQKFILEDSDFSEYADIVKPFYDSGEVTFSGKVNLQMLIEAYAKHLISTQSLLAEQFDFQDFTINYDHVLYKNIEAKRIIFCEGIKATENPFFNYLPFKGAKGQVLIVRIPNVKPVKIFKHRTFLVPLYDDVFWVGATNENEYIDDSPTEKGKQQLIEMLDKMIHVPYEILDHQAAIRPNAKDRRLFMGKHPTFDNIMIFNGLGTKGSSLAPYFADHFTDYLLGKSELMKEVDIKRFA
jgi:glycine/D-amino acid oxidase-like deaminating enzyme